MDRHALEHRVAQHYAHGDLQRHILDAVKASGKSLERLTPLDLAPVDEFHTGGREATSAIAAQLGLKPDMWVLDIGCGIGGAARFMADKYRCRVIGIDVTEEYVRTATALTRAVGLDAYASFHHASALALPFAPGTFDAATMMHVGMNIEDKDALFAEARRALKADATFAVYDVFLTGTGTMSYPVPCATSAETCFVAPVWEYRRALDAAGFEILHEEDRRDVACSFFRKEAAAIERDGVPPLGIHLLIKDPERVFANVVDMFERAVLSPIEIICRAR